MQLSSRRSNPDRTRQTKAALIEAATALFRMRPFAEVSTPEVVAAAGVTRGALYHHFSDKLGLFRAVVEAENAAVAAEIDAAAARHLAPLDALLAGGEAYLQAMTTSGRTRLMLVEAPAVLGRQLFDSIDAAGPGATLREGLVVAMDAGDLRRLPLDPVAQLFSAVYDRAALAISAGASRDEWRIVLTATLSSLRP